MELNQEVIDQLEQPLEAELIAYRDGGRGAKLAYIEGYVAIEQANRIFGYGNWGHKVVKVEPTRGPTGTPLGCEATVEFWLHGKHISTDVGFTPFAFRRDGNGDVSADMYDMAYKGAVTDAMKRAMRIMGAQFGNSLYDKDAKPAPQGNGSPPPYAGKPDTPSPQGGGTVCPQCGKNKQPQYDVCYTCNMNRKGGS